MGTWLLIISPAATFTWSVMIVCNIAIWRTHWIISPLTWSKGILKNGWNSPPCQKGSFGSPYKHVRKGFILIIQSLFLFTPEGCQLWKPFMQFIISICLSTYLSIYILTSLSLSPTLGREFYLYFYLKLLNNWICYWSMS